MIQDVFTRIGYKTKFRMGYLVLCFSRYSTQGCLLEVLADNRDGYGLNGLHRPSLNGQWLAGEASGAVM